ncbi:unnamed protein product [Spirodela intermedia]|uniref:RIN4 pathogenic type III effector avirulence factor Avr cleavage site domain-containing protein n=1 Tax=Spirodela intermedia TaxID=51605 RepID=A0A7I8JIN4_SPIIN|nr:unnamed protein product [Spirodela intermedia]CAA6670028.1 unnamed protein product [Spirodela intermedia]
MRFWNYRVGRPTQNRYSNNHSTTLECPKVRKLEKEHVQYTVFFENARVKKGAGGSLINPNDPEENPSAFNDQDKSPEEEHQERAYQQFHREQRHGRAEGGERDYYMISLPSERMKSYRSNTTSDLTKIGSQPWSREGVDERNRLASSSSSQNPSLRPKFTQQVEPQHHRVVSVPKFGDWNGGNADAGAGYTLIFEKPPPNPSYTPTRYAQDQKMSSGKSSRSKMFCCFCPKAE